MTGLERHPIGHPQVEQPAWLTRAPAHEGRAYWARPPMETRGAKTSAQVNGRNPHTRATSKSLGVKNFLPAENSGVRR